MVLGCCVFLCVDETFSQPIDPDDHPTLKSQASEEIFQPIKVTATRSRKNLASIPGAVSRVDRLEIQNFKPTLTLDESLSQVPGFFSQNPFNFAQDLRLSIRGFGTRSPFGVRGIKVLVDGFPETLPDGQTQVDAIDPGIIDHIEVIRGPSSSLYGNASGGVVSITTQEGTKPTIAPRLTFGEFGFAKEQVKLTGIEGNVSYRLYTSHLQLNGFRDHSATQNTLGQGKFRITPDSQSDWTLSFGHFDSPKADDPGSLTLQQVTENPRQANGRNILFSAGEKVRQENFGVRYRKSVSARHDLTFTTHLIRRDFSNKLPFFNGGIVEFDRIAPGASVQSVYDGFFFGKSNRFITGIDSQYQHDDRQRFNNNQGTREAKVLDQIEEVVSVGPYLRNELHITSELELVGGIRYDRVHFRVADRFRDDGDQSGSRTLSQWTGTVGGVYHWRDSLNIYGNVATVFETPTTTELINNPSGIGGFNPNLNSQESVSYEVGAKGGMWKNLRYELALFFMRSDDEIIPFELPQFPQRTFFRNAGKSQRKGVELSINFQPVEHVEGSLSYTYSDFKFAEFVVNGADLSGNDIPGIPANRVNWRLSYNHPAGIFTEWEAQHVGAFSVDNKNVHKNFAYTLASLRLGLRKKIRSFRVSAFLGLNNLLNETYNANTRINAVNNRFFEPGPPFNIYGGISLIYTPVS